MKLHMCGLLLFLLATISIGCLPSETASPAVSSKLTPEEKQALQVSLDHLEETLQNKAPFVHATLRDPATEDNLSQLWAELDGQTIECLQVWYRWHDGSDRTLAQILPLGRMLSIAEAVEDRRVEKGIPLIDAKRKTALKILDDGAGDGFFLDVGSPNPRVFYHMLEDGSPQDYGRLDQFVRFVADVHDAGLAQQKENGLVVYDLERYQVMEQKYLQGLRAQ